MNNNVPIFVVGSSRSGTTLLAAMLNAHSNIACGPESQILNKIKPRKIKTILSDPKWPKLAAKALTEIIIAEQRVIDVFDLNEAEVYHQLSQYEPSVAALFEAISGLYAKKQNKPRWAEKTPRHLLHLKTLRKAFPEGRVIRIVRDPRDSALSMRQLPWSSDSYLANLYLWCEWYENSHDFFIDDVYSMTVIYEQLIAEPHETMLKICDFIGEEFQPEMLDTKKSSDSVTTTKEVWKKQVSGPLDSSRLYRWKRELSTPEALISSVVCEKWLKIFSYENDLIAKECYRADGLDRRRIDANIPWLYQQADVGKFFLPYSTSAQRTVHFVDDQEIARWRSFFRRLHRVASDKFADRNPQLKFTELQSKYTWRRRLLTTLAPSL